MILEKQAKLLEKLITDNSPTILTAIGVVGTVTTAYLTAKASFKSADQIADRKFVLTQHGEDNNISRKDAVGLVWKNYIPAVGSGALTVAATICANRISTRRMAAMALAYSLSEKKIEELKEKAFAKLTPSKQQQVKDEIAQDRVNKNPKGNQVIVLGQGDVMCYDMPSDRYFKSNVEKIRKTQNDINQEVLGDNLPVTVADFYRYIGLKPTPASNELGWTFESLMDIEFSTVMTADQQPCIAINYDSIPIRGSKSLSDKLSEFDR